MADELFTRCPGCKTIFRVTEPQLALRGGQVRCGHCRTVFNGREELIALDAPALDEQTEDELAKGPPTVTLRSAHALDPPPPDEPRRPPPPPAPPPESAADYENRFAWETKPERSRAAKVLAGVAVPLLAVALVLQAVFHFRDALAAHMPAVEAGAAAPVRGCRLLDPSVARRGGAVDRRFRPAGGSRAQRPSHPDGHASATAPAIPSAIRTSSSRSPTPHDQVVVRRALSPPEYVSGTVNTATGIARNGEIPVKLFIDASATVQAGYRLYLFFP